MANRRRSRNPKAALRGFFPVAAWKGYRAFLLRRAKAARDLVRATIAQVNGFDRADAAVVRRDVDPLFWVRAIAIAESAFTSNNPPNVATLTGFADGVDTHSAKKTENMIERAGVAALPTFERPIDRALFSVFVGEQVKLIASLDSRYFDDVRKEIVKTFETGGSLRDLSAALEERYSVSRERAKLIAENEIGTLNAKLNAIRQGRAGVKRFKWSTSDDERVRPEHAEIDGQVFEWATGHPTEGRPGEPIRCRCVAIPVFD